MILTIDNRIKNLNTDTVYDNGKLELALSLLDKLDGGKHTLLTIERNDGCLICVGGGDNGYIVTLSSKTGDNKTLYNNNNQNNTIELCAGGQYADFPEDIVVDKDTASNTVRHFFFETEITLNWKEEV